MLGDGQPLGNQGTDVPGGELIAEWLTVPKHRHRACGWPLREVESWLLGNAIGLSGFLGLRRPMVVPNPEGLADPKIEILQAATKCPRRSRRDALVWRDKKSGQLLWGPDYNGALVPFVNDQWDIATARGGSQVWNHFSQP